MRNASPTESSTREFLKPTTPCLAPGAEEIEEVLIQMGKSRREVGLTSIQSDDLQSMPGYSGKDVIEAYRRLEGEGRLPVRGQ